MANEIVKPHSFEVAKKNIQTLTDNVPSNVSLKQFSEKNFIFSHTVTGSEVNSQLVSPLQSILISQNSNILDLYKIAGEVYKVIESLDKEYISGIVSAVKSAEAVSNQAKTASDKADQASRQALGASQEALDASKQVKTAQSDIKKTVDALRATVKILKDFKEKVDKDITSLQQYRSMLETYKHLGDVDNICIDVESHKSDLAKFHQQVDHFIESVNQTEELIRQDITALQQYRSKLEIYKHLGDVDIMWKDVEGHKADFTRLHQQVDGFIESANKATNLIKQDVTVLQQYLSKLETYKHLGDVDIMWKDVEGHKTDLTKLHQQVDGFIESANKATNLIKQDVTSLQQYHSKLETYKHLGDVDNMWGDVEGHKTDLANLHQQVANDISEVHATHAGIKDSIRRIEEANSLAHLKYEKKIKNSYYVGGCAIGLLIINFILQILGVL